MFVPATQAVHVEQLVFKGLKQGLTLFVPEKESFVYWLEVLDRRLDQAKGFFQGGAILVELGERQLTPGELAGLKKFWRNTGSGLKVSIRCSAKNLIRGPKSSYRRPPVFC